MDQAHFRCNHALGKRKLGPKVLGGVPGPSIQGEGLNLTENGWFYDFSSVVRPVLHSFGNGGLFNKPGRATLEETRMSIGTARAKLCGAQNTPHAQRT